jgi:hypothetical protein
MGGGTIPVPMAPKFDELVVLCIVEDFADLSVESTDNRGEEINLFVEETLSGILKVLVLLVESKK